MPSQPLSKTACPLPPLGMDALSLRMDTCHYLLRTLGAEETAEPVNSVYTALAMSLRDRLVERWKNTQKKVAAESGRRTFYLSLEFLLGRAMGNTLLNLGLEDAAREALTWEHRELVDIMELEPDAGLGNGGLGRLAACFLDSCASLGLPVTGYGIRYSYGMFRQEIRGGEQVEEPDHWLRNGCPWELKRPERVRRVHFFGRSDGYYDAQGRFHQRWVDTHDVLAVPYDIPIPGYRNEVVNTLRLWRAT
ncbi:MAG: glycogen/starch/alpha-glucan phosphorylase, partial [Acidithiobacillus sp.]|nr:glycogen/starch/alpha-glucan phosphorylase [Acidithiobacillus sp.]